MLFVKEEKTKKERINFKLDSEDKKKAQDICKRFGISLSDFMRNSVLDFIKKDKTQKTEDLYHLLESESDLEEK